MGEAAQLFLRFVIGGALVTAFAACADVLKPKGFAGLFGAAPSIALAGLALAIHMHGNAYAALEARSMTVGAIAFVSYAMLCVYLSGVRLMRAGLAASIAVGAWLLVAALGFLLLPK